MKLQTVYSTDNAADADVLRIALEQAGIRCELSQPTQGGLAGVDVTPVQILVRDEDLAAARKLVQQHEG